MMSSSRESIYILHLSDIHFPSIIKGGKNSNPCLGFRRLMADLTDIQSVHSLVPDMVVVSGDILEPNASEETIDILTNCFKELIDLINSLRSNNDLESISPYQFHFAPGNSDVSSNDHKDSKVEKKHLYKFLEQFYDHFDLDLDDVYYDDIDSDKPFCRTYVDKNLHAIVSTFDSCSESAGVEHGQFGNRQLEKMSSEIDKVLSGESQENRNDYIKIALFHHHIQFIPELASDVNYRICLDTPKMLEFLEQYGYDLVLHGHKHKPSFSRFSPPNFGVSSWKEILNLGAGHMVCSIEPFYYNIIQITPGFSKEQIWSVSATYRKFLKGAWLSDEKLTKTLNIRRHQRLIEGSHLEGVFGKYIESLILDFEDFDSQGKRRHLIEPQLSYDIKQYFVDPAAWDITSGGRIHDPIDLFIDEWISSDERNHVTLLGDYGFGKTSFSWNLAYKHAVEFKANPLMGTRVPFLISLHGIGRITDLNEFIASWLDKYEIDIKHKDFWDFLENGRLLVILDGFDEMESRVDEAATLNNWKILSKLAIGKAKIFITCRTPFFRSQSQVSAASGLGEETELMQDIRNRPNFEVLELREWRTEQIAKLLEKYWRENWKEYWSAVLSVNPSIVEFARRPLFLDIIIRLLPNLIQSGKPITLALLFELYVQKTLERDADISRLDSTRKLRILENFAYKSSTSPGYPGIKREEVSGFVRSVLSEEQFTGGEIEKYGIDFLNSGFLFRNAQGYYNFQSGLFAGFLTARKLHAEVQNGNLENFDKIPLSTEVTKFLGALLRDEVNLLRTFVNETKHKTFDRCLYRGSNAIMLLRLIGDDLSGQDYSNTVIRNADLSGADLTATIFNGADLRNTNLESAVLKQSQFVDADLSNAIIQEVNQIGTLKVSPDGVLVATGDNYGTIKIWDFFKRELKDAIENKSGDIWSMSWKPSNTEHVLVVGSLDKSIRIWDIDKRNSLFLGEHRDRVLGVNWHPLGRFIASSGGDGYVNVWDSINQELEWSFRLPEEVYGVSWSPDGRYLAVTHGEHYIDIWDFQTRSPRFNLTELRDTVWNVSWHPKGYYLASGSRDTTIRVWDMKYGRQVEKFERLSSSSPGHIGAVLYVTWNPVEDLIASSGGDHIVILWDWSSHRLISTHQGHNDEIWGLDWHPSGKYLVSGGNDGKIMLWEVGKNDPIGYFVQYPRSKDMNITGAKGLSTEQVDRLRRGGAKNPPPSWIR